MCLCASNVLEISSMPLSIHNIDYKYVLELIQVHENYHKLIRLKNQQEENIYKNSEISTSTENRITTTFPRTLFIVH